MENSVENSKMAKMPVGKLMLSTGAPIIVSMVLQAVYNIVDSAFVSNMETNGELAINALTLAFPVQMFMVAIGVGTGVGTNALLSKTLGQNNKEKASRTVGNSIFVSIVIYILFLLFGLFGAEFYIKTQTSNQIILQMATDHLKICSIYSFGVVFFSVFEKLLQATGRSAFSTASQITGAVINIILDPIMIYGLLGCPEMGVKGAAYATVIGQIASAVLGLVFHLRFNKEIKNSIKYLKPNVKIIGEIYSIGFPAIVSQALMSLMTYGLNIIYGKISENVVTAYGLYYKIQQFILFAAFGMRDAITPIVSFNHVLKNKRRMTTGIKYGIIFTTVIMIIGLLLIEILAKPLTSLFGLSGETMQICIGAVRIISISFIFAGANIALQGVFQALNGGLQSLIISVIRQILPIVLAWIFLSAVSNSYDNLWLMWIVFIIAEAVALLVSAFLFKGIYKKQIHSLGD
ncbi:MAG: MATE family efflux transporter [Clostridiales bacterium]|nr:MATE family efflux transporter [Clostridiales bacterium]